MKKTIFVLTTSLLGLLAVQAPAAVDLTFEAADSNNVQAPGFSGSTGGIEAGSTGVNDATQANDILNPADGTTGVQSFRAEFQWSNDTTALIRMTDANDRHLLSAPDETGGVGVYVLYDGTAGDLEINLAIREDTVNTDDNEIYENTVWKTLTGSTDWQYFYWDFTTETDSSPTESWSVANALGDGTYDGGDVGDATAYEGIFFRPITGTSTILTPVVIFLDDIHSGAVHTPLVASDVNNWSLYTY